MKQKLKITVVVLRDGDLLKTSIEGIGAMENFFFQYLRYFKFYLLYFYLKINLSY